MDTMPSDQDYIVGWICVLQTERDAAEKILDGPYMNRFGDGHDSNLYTLERMGYHNIVITYLPIGWQGGNTVIMVATRMMNKFPNIKIGLMVGIGGGLPHEGNDIRLSDMVISKSDGQYSGVVQYDLGKFTK